MCVPNALFGALGLMAVSQCTMNNFTFGNEQHQYYEMISGGTGTGAGVWTGLDGQVTGGYDGRRVPAFGLAWGAPGALGINRIERADGRTEVLTHIGSAPMQTGDVFVIETPGGGGGGGVKVLGAGPPNALHCRL